VILLPAGDGSEKRGRTCLDAEGSGNPPRDSLEPVHLSPYSWGYQTCLSLRRPLDFLSTVFSELLQEESSEIHRRTLEVGYLPVLHPHRLSAIFGKAEISRRCGGSFEGNCTLHILHRRYEVPGSKWIGKEGRWLREWRIYQLRSALSE